MHGFAAYYWQIIIAFVIAKTEKKSTHYLNQWECIVVIYIFKEILDMITAENRSFASDWYIQVEQLVRWIKVLKVSMFAMWDSEWASERVSDQVNK